MSRIFRVSFLIALFMMTCFAFAVGERPTVSFYVSPHGDDQSEGTRDNPVKTPNRALELARAVLSDAKREIVFLDGFYEFDKPIVLGARDYEYTFRAENRGKAILSAAMKVTEWRPDPTDKRLIVADLPFSTSANSLYALIVGDRLADLSSFPDGKNIVCPAKLGDGKNFHNLPYDPKSFPKGFDISSLDIASVWVVVPQEWASTRSYIATNNVAGNSFILKSRTNMAIGNYNNGFRLYNSRLGLTRPGRWMFEQTTGRIVYYPRPGETAENLNASISRVQTIFDLRGTPDCTIDGFVIEGCLDPFSNPHYSNNPLSAAISGKFAARLTVRNCEIRNCRGGGVYMLKADHSTVENCHIHHVGGQGVYFIDGGAGFCKVLGNHIHNAAGGAYVQIARTEVIGNRIHNVGRSAITLWGDFSVVASNILHDAMLSSRDGGALYGAYDYTIIKDNILKYSHNSSWPALYADEGSQHSVFTGNHIEGVFWPTHMHQTYGIVVSNNTFKFNGAMRWSFQGGTHNYFTDNNIYTTKPITSDKYIVNCSEWARNNVYVKDKSSGYKFKGSVTLPRVKARVAEGFIVPFTQAFDKTGAPPVIDGSRGSGEYPINWLKWNRLNSDSEGFADHGTQPGVNLVYSHDGTNLYINAHYGFAKFTPYPAYRNFGEIWGVHDGIKFYFGEQAEITVFWNGKTVVKGTDLQLGEGNCKLKDRGWWNGISVEMRLPIAALGIEGNVRGQSLKFNAQNYNADHDMYRFLFPRSASGEVRTGKLIFPVEDVKEIK